MFTLRYLILLTTAAALSWTVRAADAEPAADAHAGHDHANAKAAEAGHEGHAHAAVSPDQLFTVQCEHEIPQYTCDECRYELGLVKVADELIRPAGAATGLIAVAEVRTHQAGTELELTGVIQLNASREVHVSPRIAGVVREVRVDVGSAVKQGDVLFEIESTELGRAVGDYRKSVTLAALTHANLEREEKLFAGKVGAEVDLIEARMQYEQHRADQEAAEHQLRVMGLAGEDVKALQAPGHAGALGRLPYRAPRDGRIIEKHLTLGEMAEPGKDVMWLADLTTVWAELDIYEQDLDAVLAHQRAGQGAVVVTTRAYPGREFPGRIEVVGSVMNEKTRTVKARVVLDNPGELLKPGMFCRARLLLEGDGEALAVPAEAVLMDEGRRFVFKQVREAFYLRQPVQTGRRLLHRIEITEGLRAGDRIVERGAFLLKSDVLREKMGAGCAD